MHCTLFYQNSHVNLSLQSVYALAQRRCTSTHRAMTARLHWCYCQLEIVWTVVHVPSSRHWLQYAETTNLLVFNLIVAVSKWMLLSLSVVLFWITHQISVLIPFMKGINILSKAQWPFMWFKANWRELSLETVRYTKCLARTMSWIKCLLQKCFLMQIYNKMHTYSAWSSRKP